MDVGADKRINATLAQSINCEVHSLIFLVCSSRVSKDKNFEVFKAGESWSGEARNLITLRQKVASGNL